MHRRVQVEVEWFIALSDAGFAEFPPLSEAARGLLRSLVVRFSEADAQAIKDIEKTTNHDVKAVEYWIKARFKGQAELERAGEFVHFACTSEDINNTSHALMLKAAREQVLLPALDRLLAQLGAMAHALADGADAQPHARPDREPDDAGQGNRQRRGAAGHGARAHRRGAAAGQDERRGGQLQRPPGGLSRISTGRPSAAAWSSSAWACVFNAYTIQIEPHDYMAELFDAIARANTHPDRLVARRLGLHLAGLLQAAAEGRRSRLEHDAAQGQPDRLRERRGQLRAGQRAARPHERQAADQPLAARPHRQHRAAQHGRGAGLHAAGLRQPDARAGQARGQPGAARGRPRSMPGRCWPSRCRP